MSATNMKKLSEEQKLQLHHMVAEYGVAKIAYELATACRQKAVTRVNNARVYYHWLSKAQKLECLADDILSED